MDTHLNIGTNPLNGHAVRFGVMGSAGSDHDPEVVQRCRTLGRSVAQYGCCLLTGACPGLPQAAALGAKDENGHTIVISPAISFKEHVEIFHSPWQEYDVLIYTGLGFMGRELINIRSSDIVVLLGGRSGTLGEFAIAYDEGSEDMARRVPNIKKAADYLGFQPKTSLEEILQSVVEHFESK